MYWDLILMTHRCPRETAWDTESVEIQRSQICLMWCLHTAQEIWISTPVLSWSNLQLLAPDGSVLWYSLLLPASDSSVLSSSNLWCPASDGSALSSSNKLYLCWMYRDKALPWHLEQTLPLNSRCTRRPREEVTGALSCYFSAGTSSIAQIFTR